MKKRLLYLILPIITLVLEILPYGAVLNFMLPSADGTTVGQFRELYSYFDMMPFGYANFAPFITALITCVIILMLVIYFATGSTKVAFATRNVLCVCSIISLCPILLGIRFFSLVGGMISASLIVEFVLISRLVKLQQRN